MLEGWKEVKLEEIADVVGGGTPSSKEDSYWNGEVNWVTPADLSGYMFKHISSGERKITKLGLSKSSAKLHPKGTVLMTSRAPIGYLAIAGDEVATNQGFQSLRCKTDKVDNNFLYYILHLYKEGIQAIASGATFPEVSGKKVKGFKIKIPPLPIQRKIASILSAYDDLIENNLKRIKLLEEKAQLTYEEWFVRLKFPGHETTPMNKETGLPEGWVKVKLNEILKFNQGVQVPIDKQLKEKNTERVRFIRIVDVTQGGQEERFIETPRKNQMVVEKDLFMVRYGAPQVVTNFKGAIANNFFKINIIDSSKVFPKYVYCFLDRKEIREYLMGVSVSATMPAISFKSFGQIKMMLPERNLQKKFHDYVDSIFELILDFEKQNKLLKEARDILLPRLMTGKIDVEKMKLENQVA